VAVERVEAAFGLVAAASKRCTDRARILLPDDRIQIAQLPVAVDARVEHDRRAAEETQHQVVRSRRLDERDPLIEQLLAHRSDRADGGASYPYTFEWARPSWR